MRRIINLFLTIMLTLATISYPAYASSSLKQQDGEKVYSCGDGTLENPYIITTARELDAVRNNLSANYKLGNNIDLTEYLSEGGEGYTKWGESGWEPIGNSDTPFTGSFDGGYHVISGLWINRINTDNVGLFSNSSSYNANVGGIQNLGVEIAEKGIVGSSNVGGLVGYNDSEAKIRNCYVTGGSVSGVTYVGGLIGNQNVIGTTLNCYSTVDVINLISENNTGIQGCGIGGLIGAANGKIKYCYATGNVKGSYKCGGLVGEMTSMASVDNCYAEGDVICSDDCAGGLVGYIEDGTVNYSCSAGNVQGNSYIGGIVGKQGGKSGISACYSFCNVKAAKDYAGGLVGAQISPPFSQNHNAVNNCCALGSVETKGEHFGAVSGYTDEESEIGSCYRYDTFTVNGNKISEDDENSMPNKINGGLATETKLLQLPIINVALSETEKTDTPVTVRLNITDNDKIKSVSYVNGIQNSLEATTTGDIALASCDVDINLLLADPKKYSGLVGGDESAAIIYDYYINAGYPNGDINVQSVENNSFEINKNGRYIICVEDESCNKAFMCINIDNINSSPIHTDSLDYIYDIKNLSISTQSGEALSAPPQNVGFMAEVEVKKIKESDSKDYIFVAVYDKNGTMLNIDYATAKFTPNYDYSFGFNIPAQNSEIGSVKAFVWDGFNSAKPLAETKTLNFN